MEPFNQALVTNPRTYDTSTGNVLLEAANNLSDVSDAATARTNLDVYSTSEVDEYLAPKATAGGVRLDGSTGTIEFTQLLQGTVNTVSIWYKPTIVPVTSNDIIFSQHEGVGNNGRISVDHTTGNVLRVFKGGGGTTQAISSATFTLNEWHHIVIIDDSGTISAYVNNVLWISPTSGLYSGYSAVNFRVSDISSSGTQEINGSVKDLAIFNRALSATEVETLYRNGLAGIADADRWGLVTPTYTSDFSAGVDSWTARGGVLAGNIDGIGGQDDVLRYTTAADGVTPKWATKFGWTFGTWGKITFDVFIPSSNAAVDQIGLFHNTNAPAIARVTTLDSWVTVTASALSTDSFNSWRVYAESSVGASVNVNGDVFYIKNFTFQRIGCIAAYPMDEGIGYQIHDISSNHYDGLLSTSGFTHLVPKTDFMIRESGVDAYNGGSGDTAVLTSSQAILPDNYVIERVSINSNGVDVNGVFTLKKGTLAGVGIATIAPNYTIVNSLYDQNTFAVSNATSGTANNRKNLYVTAASANATSLDLTIKGSVIL